MKQNNFIKNLSDLELLDQTKKVACDEKMATLLLLDYLAEVERRRLFAERAYPSLFEFVVKELGYSESQASERINAMRLMREVPVVKDHIQSGDLTLTTASQIQRFIKSERKISGKTPDLAEKLNLISECQNKSKRDIEKILVQKSSSPVQVPKEKERVISNNLTELKFSVSEEIIEKLRELRNLSEISMADIFEAGLEALLSKNVYSSSIQAKTQNRTLPVTSEPLASSSRYIPKSIRQQIAKRSENRCEYIDPLTRKRCSSKFRLQFEHQIPFSVGGQTKSENLLHYCKAHNQLSAIQFFGRPKMREFVPGL